jgi:hypothetical protein
MALIKELFRLESADGAGLHPPPPKTLSALFAALNAQRSNAGKPPASPVAPRREESRPDASGSFSDRDNDLVFLPPPELQAQVAAPLEASLAPVVLAGEPQRASPPNSVADRAVTPPPPAPIWVPVPKLKAAADYFVPVYQPAVNLPWLY